MAFDLGNCTDVFSANGPTEFGGTGALGICHGDGYWNRIFYDGAVLSGAIMAQIGNGTYNSTVSTIYERVSSISKSWGSGGPAGGGSNFMTTVTAVTLGYWTPEETGEYTIYCKWDDNVALSFDGGQTVDYSSTYIHHAWISFTKTFTAGVKYPIMTMVYEHGGHFEIQLKYSLPSETVLPLDNNIVTDGHEFEASIWSDSVEYADSSVFEEFFNIDFGVPGYDIINNPSISTSYDAYSGINIPTNDFTSKCIRDTIQIWETDVYVDIDSEGYSNDEDRWDFLTDNITSGYDYQFMNDCNFIPNIHQRTTAADADTHYGATLIPSYTYFRLKCTVPISDEYPEGISNYILWDGGESAQQQCDKEFSIKNNSERYWLQDLDKRPTLGLITTIEDNLSEENFTGNLSDEIFEQVPKPNLLKNGNARSILQFDYKTEDYQLGPDSFKPAGGWGYQVIDGIFNDTDVNPDLKKMFIQDENFSDFYEIDQNSVTKYYWELMLELFQTYLQDNLDGTAGSQISTQNVSLGQCGVYFTGKYGMDYAAAYQLCNDLTYGINDWNDGFTSQQTHNITMGVFDGIDSEWEIVLQHVGLCQTSDNGYQSRCRDQNGVTYSAANPPTLESIPVEHITEQNIIDNNLSGVFPNAVEFIWDTPPSNLQLFGYSGYFPYVQFIEDAYIDSDGISWPQTQNMNMQFSKWVKDDECYSYNRCLKFQANDEFNDTNNLVNSQLNDLYIYKAEAAVWHGWADYYGESWSTNNKDGDSLGGSFCSYRTQFGSHNGVSGEYYQDGNYGSPGPFIVEDQTGNPTAVESAALNLCNTTMNNNATWDYSMTNQSGPDCKCFLIPTSGNRIDEDGSRTHAELVAEPSELLPHLEEFSQHNNNEYRVLNQFQKIYTGLSTVAGEKGDDFLNPFSSLKVSFWMKTLGHSQQYGGVSYPSPAGFSFDEESENDALKPYVEVGVIPFRNHYNPTGDYNSLVNYVDTQETNYNLASMGRFVNTAVNEWEHFEFEFNLNEFHTNTDEINIHDLFFVVQSSGVSNQGGFRGTVYLDEFSVVESYNFQPDVDVRKKKGPDDYGIGSLTEYYDKELQPEHYKDTAAPLEAQFYFYPRYFYNTPIDKDRAVIFKDFSRGMFYLYDVDWGDGSPNEFNENPKKLGDDVSVYHTYNSAGIYEITGTMLRTKPDKDFNPLGVIHNKRFTLTININEAGDEDFPYFGAEGFSFVPFKNTLPMIGGYSEESVYYKNIKRQLGIVTKDAKVNTEFKSPGDRLKTELSLDKMDLSFSDTGSFVTLDAFKKVRNIEKDGSGEIIFSGLKTYSAEFGKFIGDTDITNIKYYSEPKQMWEMLGFIDDASQEFENLKETLVISNMEYYSGVVPGTQGATTNDANMNDGTIGDEVYLSWDVDPNYESQYDLTYRIAQPKNTPMPVNYNNFYPLSSNIENNVNNYNTLRTFQMDTDSDDDSNYWWNGVMFTETDNKIVFSELFWKAFFGNTINSNTYEYPFSYTAEQPTDDEGNVISGDAVYNYNGTIYKLFTQRGSYIKFTIDGWWTDYDGNHSSDQDWNSVNAELSFASPILFYNITVIEKHFVPATSSHPGNPSSKRYWKNIIPQDYSIFNRDGLIENQHINIHSNQDWIDVNEYGNPFYYPVLPRHSANGGFIRKDYPIDESSGEQKIEFPKIGPITDSDNYNPNLKISIDSTNIEPNILNDNSGNNNFGFSFNDYKVDFEEESLQPQKRRDMDFLRTSKKRGAF